MHVAFVLLVLLKFILSQHGDASILSEMIIH